MTSRKRSSVVAITLLGALAVPVWMAAEENSSQDHKSKHHKYKLVDLGTFGGPNSTVSSPYSLVLNNHGSVVGWAEIPTHDPYDPNCLDPDCFVPHAFRWQNDVLTDLGTLPGGSGSFALWINERGLTVGASENGLIDPLTGYPQLNAVVWKDGQIVNLGTLGGNQSQAFAVNDHDQVVGGALNAIPDPFSSNLTLNFLFFNPSATQAHAFLWREGVMQDLGTLGGPDSIAGSVNERGEVAGLSFTNSTPNPATGMPTMDPFLWVPCHRNSWDKDDCEDDRERATAEDGTMIDLGTLGGTLGFAVDLNNRGEVIGQSNLAGDVNFHAFVWERGRLKDLGTLGGNTSSARWINDTGEVVGRADIAGSKAHHAFLWKKGMMTDLGTVAGDPCSTAYGINSRGQIVGISAVCKQPGHGFLWENGGPIVDLQTLVLPGSDLTIKEVYFINDAGEIAGFGTLPNGDQHALLLIPKGECDEDCEGRNAANQNDTAQHSEAARQQGSKSPARRTNEVRDALSQRYHIPGLTAAPSN